MSINPNPVALLRQGVDEYNAGRREQAEQLIRQAVAADPNNEQGWLWLAAVVRDLHEVESALQHALAINPSNLETAAHLATVRAKLDEEGGERFKAPTGERPALRPRPAEAATTVMPTPAPPPSSAASYIAMSAPMTAPPVTLPPNPQPVAAPPAIAPSYNPQTTIYNIQSTIAPAPPPMMLTSVGPPFILRALYFVFVGWWLTYLWVTFAWVLNVTIIGLPIGLTMLNLVPQVLTLEPVRRNFIAEYTASGRLVAREVVIAQLPLLPRAIWFVLVGWWLSLLWLMLAATLCFTLIGLPLGIWMFHRSPTITTLRRL